MKLDPIFKTWLIPEFKEVDAFFRKNFSQTGSRLTMKGRAESLGCYGMHYRIDLFPHPLLSQEYLELKLVTEGQCRMFKDGQECRLMEGDVFFLEPAHRYGILPVEGKRCSILLLCFLPQVLGLENSVLRDRARLLAFPMFEPFVREDAVFRNVLRMPPADFRRVLPHAFSILHHFFQNETGDSVILKSLFSLLFQEIGKNYRTMVPELKRTHRAVPQVIAYIRGHLDEPLSLDKLALLVRLDPHYLSRLFNRTTGESISRFINRERLELAKLLLSSADLSVTSIVYRSGFGSVGHFNQVFKTAMGVTPSVYKKNGGSLVKVGAGSL